jgi:CRP/FNR family transcriptional regulator
MLDGGKKMIIDVLGPNDIFGDIHKLLSGHGSGDQVYGANMNRLNGDENFAEAVSDCLIGVANKEDFFVMLSNNPEMGVRVIESLGRRLRVTESKVKEMAMQNVGDRIVTELVRMYLRYGAKRCGEWLLLEHKFTHEALGNLIGVSREAVTRNLAALSRRGLVKHSKGYFRIHRSLIKKTDENN